MAAFSAQSRDWSGLRRRLSEYLCAAGLSSDQKADGYRLLRKVENEELAERLIRKDLHPSAFDGNAAAGSLWQAAGEICLFSPRSLFIKKAPRPLPLFADEQAFYRILLHLVCNCFLYAGQAPLVRFETKRLGKNAVFILRDLGPGLSPTGQQHLFSPGSGLWLAREFSIQSGGNFLLVSGRGKGVSAALSLPLCTAAALPAAPSSSDFLKNAFSPVFVQLSPRCILPEI